MSQLSTAVRDHHWNRPARNKNSSNTGGALSKLRGGGRRATPPGHAGQWGPPKSKLSSPSSVEEVECTTALLHTSA
eukprot:1786254-Pyramimonas_sp.AAC.1